MPKKIPATNSAKLGSPEWLEDRIAEVIAPRIMAGEHPEGNIAAGRVLDKAREIIDIVKDELGSQVATDLQRKAGKDDSKVLVDEATLDDLLDKLDDVKQALIDLPSGETYLERLSES